MEGDPKGTPVVRGGNKTIQGTLMSWILLWTTRTQFHWRYYDIPQNCLN